jgi:hypothetical protein|tara:strand:+ start:61 stop:405 length:345 start_codon:yes stop_codon:yes gene_type:complete
MFAILVLCTNFIWSTEGNPTDEKARLAVEDLLSKGKELPDNCCPPASLIKWNGLVTISETEMQAKARIQHKDGKMNGAFVLHKAANGEWVIDKVNFSSDNGWAWWVADVFQKVK